MAILMVVAHVLGFALSMEALLSTRTAQGAIAWIVSLNTFPYVTVPAYLVFGRSRFHGYVIARREDESDLGSALAEKTQRLQAFHAPLQGHLRGIRAVERLAKMPSLGGNRVELLVDGDETFASMLAGIEAAERYVLVQFYIVRDDQLGRELHDALVRKARAGLPVYFLYDEIGSYQLTRAYLDGLAEAGVRVSRFHSTRGSGNRFQLNFRNHRKVVVVDGQRGWVGGLNVGDEYLGRDPAFGPWRDTHLLVEGPAALCLQLSFIEDWHWATEEIPDFDWDPVVAGDISVLVLPSGPADRFETASLMIQHAIHSATQRIWITSPYFVPDESVIGALKLAALRGVEVRVVIPEQSDNVLAYLAAYAFIGPLLEAGIDVYRYREGFLHGKAFLVDGVAAGIGTVNLDNRSFRLNFEITALVIDEAFAAEVEAMFRSDFSRSRTMTLDEVDGKPFWFRAASRAAYLLAPVL